MSFHFATVDFFTNMSEEDRQAFASGFYDNVDFDDRDKEVSWGSPWIHGYFDEHINFVGSDPYNWGVQYAIQMKMGNWYNLAEKQRDDAAKAMLAPQQTEQD